MRFNKHNIKLFLIMMLVPSIGMGVEPPRQSRTPEEIFAFEKRMVEMTLQVQEICISMVEGGRDQDRRNRELSVAGFFPWLGIRLGFVQTHDFQKMAIEKAKSGMERHKQTVEELRKSFYGS